MCSNQAPDATGSHTWFPDAQDAQDANLTSLESGCNTNVPDAPYIFADDDYTKEGCDSRTYPIESGVCGYYLLS